MHGLPVAAAVSEVLALLQLRLHLGTAHTGVAVSVHPVGEPCARDADLGGVAALDPSFVRIVYFGAPQIVVDPFRGGISGTTHVQVLNAMDLAVTHQSVICVGSA